MASVAAGFSCGGIEAVLTASTGAAAAGAAGLAAATVAAPAAGAFSVWPMRSNPSCMPLACFSAVVVTPIFLATDDSVSPFWTT